MMDEGQLWDAIRPAVESGEEGQKIELKQQLDLVSERGKAKFIKSVCAIANTPGGPGYLVVGVLDQRHRTSTDPAEYVLGVEIPDVDGFRLQIVQLLRDYTDPDPDIQYREVTHPPTGKRIGVIVIPMEKRPHLIQKDLGSDDSRVREGQIYVRRGSRPFLAVRDEIIEMIGEDIRLSYEADLQSEREKHTQQVKGLEDNIKHLNDEISAMQEEIIVLNGEASQAKQETMEWIRLARGACGQLNQILPEAVKEDQIRRLLIRYNKQQYYDSWFTRTGS